MVFNEQNYPNMVRLFEEIGVEAESTAMSFRYAVKVTHPSGHSSMGLQCLLRLRRGSELCDPGLNIRMCTINRRG